MRAKFTMQKDIRFIMQIQNMIFEVVDLIEEVDSLDLKRVAMVKALEIANLVHEKLST